MATHPANTVAEGAGHPADGQDWAIDIRGLSRSFGPRQALADVDLQVPVGAVVGLIGPNGAGKTTLVRLLTGLLKPDAGTTRVLGRDPWADGDQLRGQVGVLTEMAGHYKHMTALEELEFFGRLHGVAHPALAGRRWLEAVGLGDALHQKVGGFSTGMARRLGLARALLHEPRLILLDEPTSGLDPGGIRHVLRLLADEARARGATVVLCSHVLAQLETVCDHYAILHQGKLIASGTFDDLADQAGLAPSLRLKLTGEVPAEALGLPLLAMGDDQYLLTLGNEGQIPAAIRQLAGRCSVHSAVPQDRELERLYFALVGGPR